MSTLPLNTVQTYAIDPSHSRLGFSVRHLGFSKVRGSFEQAAASSSSRAPSAWTATT